nr:histone chaperone cia1-like [Lolium perenne]
MDPFEIHRDLEQEDLFEDIIRDGPEADREERDSGDGEDRGSGDGEADGSGDGEADGFGDGEADGSGHGEASEDKLEKRGPAKRLSPKDHFTIEAISPKGQPVAPAAVRVTFKNHFEIGV